MIKIDKRVDAYIEKAPDFAKPVLIHFRKLIHRVCPDVIETIKWGCPNFEYKGPMCTMATFKEHCAIGFWKAALISNGKMVKKEHEGSAGSFGKITSLNGLPADKEMSDYIKEAMKLNEQGIKIAPKEKSIDRSNLIVPEILNKALSKNKKARNTYEAFSPSHKKEYIEWINEAKTDATRDKRVATTIEWLLEGKSRMWKYQSKK